MIVRIKKAASERHWYSNLINQSFVVYRYIGSPHFWVSSIAFLEEQDVEEITEAPKNLLATSFLFGHA